MSKKPNYYNQVLQVFQELHKNYPEYNIGRHISTALSDYGDVWGVTDKEFLFAMSRYKEQLALDFKHTEDDVDKILKDGMDLENLFKEEDGESY